MKYIWLAVSDDEYELPAIVADTPSELATHLNIDYQTVIIAEKRNSTVSKKYKIRKVVNND